MNLYLIRHGETEWNSAGRLQGTADVPLSEKGREQARSAREAAEKIGVDLIISSPQKRALETAYILNENMKVPIITDARIAERNFGPYEGALVRETPIIEMWKWNDPTDYGAETMEQLRYRVFSLLDEIKVKYPDSRILLTTHGGVSVVADFYFTGRYFVYRSTEKGKSGIIKNCQIAEFTYSDMSGRFETPEH